MSTPATSCMYYVALVCPPELNEKIRAFKLWMKANFGCTVALKSPAHITLVPPFWLPTAQRDELLKTFESFVSEQESFSVTLNGFSHFGRKVLFVQVDPNSVLEKLFKDVMEHFPRLLPGVIKNEERPFHPHVTIANRDLHPADFLTAWEYFSQQQFRESFTAHTISLLKLETGKWSVIAQHDWTSPV